MQTSTVHAIYWTGGMPLPAGYRTTVDRYFADVAADSGKTSNVYAAATEYYQTVGGATSHVVYQTSFAGSVVDTTAFVKHCTLPVSPADEMCVTDADVQARVIASAIANGWPTGASDAYFVITPPGMGVCYVTNQCSDNLFCAYHSWTGPGEGDVTTQYAYAVEPYQQDVGGCDLPANPNGAPADVTINTISHEHNEVMTDPFGAGWLDANGLENGDKSPDVQPDVRLRRANRPERLQPADQRPRLVELQGEWSNDMGGCFQIGSPTLASASPSAGGAGTPVGVTGTNFFNVGSLKFSGVTAAKTVDSPTHVTATVPSGATPSARISLATDFGTATSGFSFSVPVIVSGVAPLSGAVGMPVTISGSGFNGMKSVKFTGLGGTGVERSHSPSRAARSPPRCPRVRSRGRSPSPPRPRRLRARTPSPSARACRATRRRSAASEPP